MIAEKTINTRLVLRNADLSAWEQSKVVLLKGELAMARLSGAQDGSYKVRIGTGDKTWSQLSDQGQLIIPAKNVEGLAEAIAALSTTYRECSDISELSTEQLLSAYVEGDIAVEKKNIGATGRQEYCAYRFSKAGRQWKALDGNYSAENVYFREDITLAGEYSSVGNIHLSDDTLPAAGKSVKTLMENIFTKELDPVAVSPYYTFSTSGSAGAKEVGDTYTVPGATFTYNNAGSYTFDPNNASCEIPALSVTLKRTAPPAEALTKTNDAAVQVAGNVQLGTGTEGKTLLDYESRESYTYECAAYHTAGVMPKTNLGNDCPGARIPAGNVWSGKIDKTTYSQTALTATFYGYRSLWLGSTADATSPIDETFIKANLTAVKADGAKKYEIGAGTTSKTPGYTHLTLADGAKRIIVALPSTGNYKRTLSQVLLQSASNTPVTDSYKSKPQVDVGGKVAGANLMKYNVYVYQPDAIGADEVHDIQIG